MYFLYLDGEYQGHFFSKRTAHEMATILASCKVGDIHIEYKQTGGW